MALFAAAMQGVEIQMTDPTAPAAAYPPAEGKNPLLFQVCFVLMGSHVKGPALQ